VEEIETRVRSPIPMNFVGNPAQPFVGVEEKSRTRGVNHPKRF
jgi:hypothetical protein